MTREEILTKLTALAGIYRPNGKRHDPEMDHVHADEFLLEYINDPEITAAFNSVTKWYA